MNRRRFFSAFAGAPAAGVIPAPAPAPKLQMRIRLDYCRCGAPLLHEGDFWDQERTEFAICRNEECSQVGVPVIPVTYVEVKQRDAGVVEAVRLERHLAQIKKYKQAWMARMDAGNYGPLHSCEEGRVYGPCIVSNGKMRLMY